MNMQKKIGAVKALVEQTNGQIFSVLFTKQNGEERQMVCRTGVTKYLKGGKDTKAAYSQYINVFDTQKGSYRTINAESLTRFKCGSIDVRFQ